MKLTLALALLSGFLAHGQEPPVKPPCCRTNSSLLPASDKSLYQLESKWTSDFGREIKLGLLRGRPQVLTMFFTRCEYACPIIVDNLKSIEKALPEKLRGQVDFLLVSLDTVNDTVDAMHVYRGKKQLADANWTLLRGGEDDVRELTALLGVNYRRDAKGQFSHSNVITLLNSEGEIVFQQPGLNKAAGETVAAIEKLFARP